MTLSTVQLFQIDSSHGCLVVTLEMSVPCLVTNSSVLHTLAVEELGADARNTFALHMETFWTNQYEARFVMFREEVIYNLI